MNAIAQPGRATALPTRPAGPRLPLAVIVAATGAVATCVVLVLSVVLGLRIGAEASLTDLAQAVLLRFGPSWIALGGVALLGVGLVGRPARDGRTARAPATPGRPQLRLVVSEDHR